MSCSTDGLRGGFDAACLPPGGGENKRQVAVGRTEGGESVRFSDGPLGQGRQSHNATDVPPLPYDRRNIGEQMWWMMPKSRARTVSKLHEKWDINQGQMFRFASCAIKIPRRPPRPSIPPP